MKDSDTPVVSTAADWPRRVMVLVGRKWVDATAHGHRISPHGDEILIGRDGRLAWVHSSHVREQPRQ